MRGRGTVFLIVVLLSVAVCLSGVPAAVGDGGDADAVAVVESYLGALVRGDIDGMKQRLAPELLHKKASVLDSPSYDRTLRSFYENATFSIVDTRPEKNDRIRVDTQIVLGSGHLMVASFIVVKDAAGVHWIAEEVE